MFDYACEFLAGVVGGIWITPLATVALELQTFRTGCAALIMGAIEALLLEAGPAGVLALPAIGWASNLICGILIKQAFLTVVPDARQTYNSARRQFCHKANCLVFADTLSDHEHCGHCDNPVSPRYVGSMRC